MTLNEKSLFSYRLMVWQNRHLIGHSCEANELYSKRMTLYLSCLSNTSCFPEHRQHNLFTTLGSINQPAVLTSIC